MNVSYEDISYALESGIIDGSQVEQMVEMSRRKEILDKHRHKLFEGSNGRWVTYVDEPDGKRRQISRKTKKELEDYIYELGKDKIDNPTIDELFTKTNQARLDRGKISFGTWRRDDRYFSKHYRDTGFGRNRIRNVTKREFATFIEDQVLGKKLTAKAYAGLKGVTTTLLKSARARDYIPWSIVDLFESIDISRNDFKRNIKNPEDEIFTIEETAKMIDYLIENLDLKNAAILLMFVTGIRVGELVSLTSSDFDERGFYVYVHRTETRIKENGKEKVVVKDSPKTEEGVRLVIVPEDFTWLVNRLREESKDREWTFIGTTGNRLSAKSVRTRLEKVCEAVGIKSKSPHKIRKTYGTILQDNMPDPVTIAQMGHTDIATTRQHYYYNRTKVEDLSKKLGTISEFKLK